jgi:hypothetical protein
LVVGWLGGLVVGWFPQGCRRIRRLRYYTRFGRRGKWPPEGAFEVEPGSKINPNSTALGA